MKEFIWYTASLDLNKEFATRWTWNSRTELLKSVLQIRERQFIPLAVDIEVNA